MSYPVQQVANSLAIHLNSLLLNNNVDYTNFFPVKNLTPDIINNILYLIGNVNQETKQDILDKALYVVLDITYRNLSSFHKVFQPLDNSLFLNNKVAIQLLIDLGADINICNKYKPSQLRLDINQDDKYTKEKLFGIMKQNLLDVWNKQYEKYKKYM